MGDFLKRFENTYLNLNPNHILVINHFLPKHFKNTEHNIGMAINLWALCA